MMFIESVKCMSRPFVKPLGNGFCLMLLLLVAPVLAVECGEGCYPHAGQCACDQAPIEAASTVKPSDEKPPRSGRHEVDGATPQSLIYQDAKHDQEIKDATDAGKRAAGLN